MTAVRTAPAVSPLPSPGPIFAGPPPPARRPRNLVGAALGLLLVLLCATAVAVYTADAGHRRPVLVMVRNVPVGATISSRDIAEARVAADPSVHAIAGSSLDRVVGRVAAVTLVSGTLLTNSELASGPTVPAGSAVVGLNIKVGYAPVGLRPGDPVELVLALPAAAGANDPLDPPVSAVLARQATVFDVTVTPDGQAQIVSVVVDTVVAPVLAADGARGEVSVILLGGSR
jgi:hypothetical protein